MKVTRLGALRLAALAAVAAIIPSRSHAVRLYMKRNFLHVCCDCYLAHNIWIKDMKDGTFEIVMERNETMTQRMREIRPPPSKSMKKRRRHE